MKFFVQIEADRCGLGLWGLVGMPTGLYSI